MNDRHHTAIHEAGHAVIGRALTMLCGGATIRVDEEAGEAGHAITEDPFQIMAAWEEREKWREFGSVWTGRILTFMAGAEAEREILGGCQGEDGETDGDDRYQIALMFHDSADEAEHVRLEARLRRFARQLVRRHRADIERVAAALEERETLTGEEIDALLPPTFMGRPITWALALP